MRSIPVLLLSVALSLPACLVELDEVPELARQRVPLTGGVPATGDADVPLLVTQKTDGTGAVCTGTLISPRVVVTAAHCLLTPPELVESSEAYFGSTFLAADPHGLGSVPIISAAWDAEFDADVPEAGHDLGLVLLERPAPVAPIHAFNRAPLDGMVGAEVRYVGWGQTGVDVFDSGVKREATSRVTEVLPGMIRSGSATANNCRGDSGGPLFLEVDGEEVVAGVASFGDIPCTEYSYHTRVDGYTEAIDEYLATHDPPSCDADHRCVAGCGDPDCASDGDGGGDGGDDGSAAPLPEGAAGGCAAGGVASPVGLLAGPALIRRRRARR